MSTPKKRTSHARQGRRRSSHRKFILPNVIKRNDVVGIQHRYSFIKKQSNLSLYKS